MSISAMPRLTRAVPVTGPVAGPGVDEASGVLLDTVFLTNSAVGPAAPVVPSSGVGAGCLSCAYGQLSNPW
ncbi:hypothetical protein GCM10010149_77440 [Nonomuraea roseoviolacea subsp. roseoviolacea]